jgi:hypothetical protein
MPKLIAPHDTSWRGRAVAGGEAIDVAEADIAELIAHGFRAAENESKGERSQDDDLATLSRKELLKRLRGRGAGNILVLPTEELRKLAAKILVEARDDG